MILGITSISVTLSSHMVHSLTSGFKSTLVINCVNVLHRDFDLADMQKVPCICVSNKHSE